MIKHIKKCRNCNNKSFINLFSLGKLKFTGKFPQHKEKIPYGNLTLVMCKSCKLVQLNEIFNMKYLYNKDYGYRTGINNTMSNHVKHVVRKLSQNSKLKKNDNVLFIQMILMDSNYELAMNLGETYLVTENGNERLDKEKLDLTVL